MVKPSFHLFTDIFENFEKRLFPVIFDWTVTLPFLIICQTQCVASLLKGFLCDFMFVFNLWHHPLILPPEYTVKILEKHRGCKCQERLERQTRHPSGQEFFSPFLGLFYPSYTIFITLQLPNWLPDDKGSVKKTFLWTHVLQHPLVTVGFRCFVFLKFFFFK